MTTSLASYAARIRKALVAAASAFAVPFLGALTDSSDQGQTVTQGEWSTALIAAVLAGFAVFWVKNATVPTAKKAATAKDAGHADWSTVLIAAAVSIVVLAIYVKFIQ